MMKLLLLVSLTATLFGMSQGVVAQELPHPYTTPGFLKDWEWSGVSGNPALDGTAAEMKALVGNMLKLRELLKSSPVAGKPVGYNTILTGHFEPFSAPERPDLKAGDFPLSALIWFGAFQQEFDEKGKLLHTIGEAPLMGFYVNRLPRWVDKPIEWRDQNTDVALHPRHFPDLEGHPHFGDMLVLKKSSRPLWIPVSFEESFKLTIAHRKQAVAQFESTAVKLRKDYAEYLDATHRAERQANYKIAAQYQKDPAAFLAQMNKIDVAGEEILRKQVGMATPEASSYWADAIAKVKEAEHDFASLSSDQKAAPACYMDQSSKNNPDTRPLVSFVPVGTPRCRPVIRPNWSYFDPTLPRTAIQLITIWVRACPNEKLPENGDPSGCPANMALLHSLDWEKLKAIMDR